jgi:plasmid stabilization system protein ParE
MCNEVGMTKLLEEAIERVRQLPEAVQDEAAEILLSLASKRAEPVHLDEPTRQAAREGKAQASRGGIRVGRKDRCVLQAPRWMRVRYTFRALADLQEIHQYFQTRQPTTAQSLKLTIERQIGCLANFPYIASAADETGIRARHARRRPRGTHRLADGGNAKPCYTKFVF